MTENETIKIIKQRRSTRKFLEKQVSENDLSTLVQTGLYAPHGSGDIEQDINFTIIQNKDILDKVNLLAKEAAKQSEMEWLKDLGNNDDF
jgi:nitroreductase